MINNTKNNNILNKFNSIILLTAMISFSCVLIFNIVSWDLHTWLSTCYILLRIGVIIIITYMIEQYFKRKSAKILN